MAAQSIPKVQHALRILLENHADLLDGGLIDQVSSADWYPKNLAIGHCVPKRSAALFRREVNRQEGLLPLAFVSTLERPWSCG
jgi:hypothetical protein